VGPDNGLLWLAAEASGPVEKAVDLSQSRHGLEPVSATFHGRDIFAPVAARLALGDRLEDVGNAFPPGALERIELSPATVEKGAASAAVVWIDHFGNVQLNLGREEVEAAGFDPGRPLGVSADRSERQAPGTSERKRDGSPSSRCTYARTFDDVPEGELVLYEDSYGAMAIAENGGHAARTLGVAIDERVRLGGWTGP
jgi:S-adenosylmethionine hydrolase